MIFLRGSGLMPDVQWDALDPDARAVLEEYCLMFFQSGGVLLPEAFASLTNAERVAVANAKRSVEASRAASIGIAAHSPKGAACVMAAADGGEAIGKIKGAEQRFCLSSFVDQVAVRLESKQSLVPEAA